MDLVPLPTLAGALDPYEGVNVEAYLIAADTEVSGAFLSVVGAPQAADAVVEIRTAPDGGGDGLSVTILQGENNGTWSGSLPVTAGSSLWYWVVEGGGALELSGNLTLSADPAFTTIDRVKRHGGITDSSLDLLISGMIGGRTRAMQRWMRSYVLQKTHTDERYSGADGWTGELLLSEAPWQTVTSVTENGEALVEDEDFVLDPERAFLQRGTWQNRLTWARGEIRVSGTSGYQTVPDDLREAATEQVRHDLQQAQPGGDQLGETSRAQPQGGQTSYLAGGWLPSVVEVMSTYRETGR